MGSGHTDDQGAAVTLIGDCPYAEVSIRGDALTWLLDTGSQVPLMQHNLSTRKFPGCRVNNAPSFVKLKAASGLKIPYIAYAVKDFETGA